MSEESTISFKGVSLNESFLLGETRGNQTVAAISTQSLWSLASQWVWYLGGTANLLLGTFGNVMSLIVLYQLKSDASSIHSYLAALAVTDTVTLHSLLGVSWIKFVLSFDVYGMDDWACKTGMWVGKCSGASSFWILVFMTIHRAASVVFPHRVNVMCTKNTTKMVTAGVPVVMPLLYSHMLYGFSVHAGVCGFHLPSYKQFWLDTWVKLELIFLSLLPFCLLILSNVILSWHLFLSVKVTKHRLTSENLDGHVTQRKKQTSSTTVTVLAVSLTFISLSAPLMFYNAVANVYGNRTHIKNREQALFLYHLFYWMISMNTAINFYLYCLTGSKFRQQFLNMFSCKVSKNKVC